MQIVSALFVENFEMRQAPGPSTRIDLTGAMFSMAAPGEAPVTIAPHLVGLIFCPPDEGDDEWKKDPNSEKKLLKGDGALETVKVVLGWLIDTVAGTIELPPHRLERLLELLDAFP